MRYMFCHVNNICLVSQPYSHSNYKEIPPINWMTLVNVPFNGPKFSVVLVKKSLHSCSVKMQNLTFSKKNDF